MVRRTLDLIRGQSKELRSHIWEFQRQVGPSVAPTAGAAPGHDSTHEPCHGGLDPGEHISGASRRGVRRPVCGAAAAPFPRIAPQLGRAGRRQSRWRRGGGGGGTDPQMVKGSFIQSGVNSRGRRVDDENCGDALQVNPCTPPLRVIDNSSAVVNAEIHRRLSGHVMQPWTHTAKRKKERKKSTPCLLSRFNFYLKHKRKKTLQQYDIFLLSLYGNGKYHP